MTATPSAARPSLSVVVVTWQPGDDLDRFLDSLPAATTSAPPVVLADNGSTDGSVERNAARPGVTLLRTGANLGYGAAANLAVRTPPADSSELVLVANPDLVWHPGALDELVDATYRWPRAGAFGPAILTTDGDLYPSARSFPSL